MKKKERNLGHQLQAKRGGREGEKGNSGAFALTTSSSRSAVLSQWMKKKREEGIHVVPAQQGEKRKEKEGANHNALPLGEKRGRAIRPGIRILFPVAQRGEEKGERCSTLGKRREKGKGGGVLMLILV